MINLKVLLLLFFLCPVNLFSQSAQEFNEKSINEILNQYVTDDGPGMAVGIVKNGQVIYENYRGLSNLEHEIKVNKKTRFNIASTAKQFTALMILQLSKEGKLSLEDDIRKYMLSLYPKVEEEIKIRHLINHTSGIRDYVFIFEMQNNAWWQQMGSDNDDVIELLEKQEELVFEPGTRYSYSNSGYTILAEIIEKVTGMKFNDYAENFFQELGMNETSFVRRYMGVIPHRASPYSDWGDGKWLATPMVTKFNGDGFLYTTLKDQLIYEVAVQNANRENNTLLIESQKPIPNSEITTYGFGLELDGRLGRLAPYHSGSTFGYHSHTTRFLQENLSVFVMSNNGKIWSGDIADKISLAILPDNEMVKEEQYNTKFYDTSTMVDQVQITGQYNSPEGRLIRVVEKDGKFYWKRANRSPIELVQDTNNIYHPGYDPKMKMVFYNEKMVIYYPSGKSKAYERNPGLPASLADLEGYIGKYESSELEMSFTLRLTEENELKLKFSNRERERDVEVLNRDELLSSNFVLKVIRDQFDRVREILITLNNRAENNRFRKKTNLQYQPKIATEYGSIQVATINSRDGETSDILLTRNHPNGNEIWSKRFGGTSYDKASSILATEDGYLIIGSTSSYGNGNYDMYVLKTDKEGNQQWQKTYGGFYNEYGYSAQLTEEGYLIKGTKQECTSNSDVFNRECTTRVWFVSIDKDGKEISSEILEEI